MGIQNTSPLFNDLDGLGKIIMSSSEGFYVGIVIKLDVMTQMDNFIYLILVFVNWIGFHLVVLCYWNKLGNSIVFMERLTYPEYDEFKQTAIALWDIFLKDL